MHPPPALEQVLEHARKTEWPYSEEEIERAYQSFEVAKAEDGSWFWGKRPVVDWRAGIELRCSEARKTPAPGFVNGRLMTVERLLRDIGNPPPDQLVERRKLMREHDDLIEQQKKASEQ